MPHSGEKCLRCVDMDLRLLPESTREVQFYRCPKCGRDFSKKPGQQLHDRWLSPISLMLYLVISNKDPRERIDEIVDLFIEQRDLNELSAIVFEIDRELDEPTQRVTDILDFVHAPSEELLREYLRDVSLRFKEHLKKAEEKRHPRTWQEKNQPIEAKGLETPCSVCGKPGHVQQIPGVPPSGCFCEDHVPTGTIKPVHALIVLGLLLGLGWLIFTFFK